MYENQNEHCAINVFFQSVDVRNVIFRFFFTRLGKGRGNSNWFPFGHVLLITETSQTTIYRPVRNEIHVSLRWINIVACGNN